MKKMCETCPFYGIVQQTGRVFVAEMGFSFNSGSRQGTSELLYIQHVTRVETLHYP